MSGARELKRDGGFGFRGWTAAVLVAALTIFALLLSGGQAKSADTSCRGGERSTIDVGIARANACWTRTGTGDKTLYTAKWNDQPAGVGLDLNGFVLGRSGKDATGITFNPATREVESIGEVQLYSRNWPLGGLNPLGFPFHVDFTVPKDGEMVIEETKVNVPKGVFTGVLAGMFAPVTNVETPTTITEDGKGSIGFTVQLSGIFTLKGKTQTATVEAITELGKGTALDGFSLELNEIDALRAVILENFSAYYSASKQTFGGEAAVRFPFLDKDPSKREGKGIIAGFGVTKGRLTNVKFGVTGLKIPIGSAGFLTSIAGAGTWGEWPDFLFEAKLSATFGTEVPVPWGEPAAPIGVNGALKVGSKNQEVYFRVDGGMSLFNIPLAQAYLGIYTKTGVEFGAGIGIGVPSLRDRPSDPFYLGARIDGWIAKGKFQFTGRGRIRLFNVPLLDADAMVSSSVIGACAQMFWFNVGAVYTFKTKSTETFGKSCGLDRYKEKFPGSALVSGSAANPRSFSLTGREAVLAVRGEDGAPRFTLTSDSGEVIKVPVGDDGVKRDDNAVFVSEEEDVTNVLLKDPKGRWEITPYPGSPAITGLKAGQPMPEEKVEARVVGRGMKRTLVWDSKGQPNTTLVFTEEMKGGVENPILSTGKAGGRKRFKVTSGGLYGRRKLRVTVLHGDAPRQEKVVDRYVVKPPPRPKAPRKVRAWRNEQNAMVTWNRVKGASNYFIQVRLPKSRTWKGSFVRLVGPRIRRVLIEGFPSGGVARARVVAINRGGRFGKPGHFSFRTDPRPMKLGPAAARGVRSARREGNGIGLMTVCPSGGHCDLRVRLYRGKRVIGFAGFQQTPDTFRHLKVRPKSKALRKRLARGRLGKLRIVISESRNGKKVTASRKL